MRKSDLLSKALRMAGGAQVLNGYWGKERLTVLAYHRILEWERPDFDFYTPNVSATPAMFAQQMDYIARHFNVVDLQSVLDFVHKGQDLPPKACLITFDDGYRDNYEQAWPILKKHGFPAVIFLMTDAITHSARPWWDQCAYYFFHSPQQSVDLPFIGQQDLSNPASRHTARENLIRHIKTLPDSEKQKLIGQLSTLLDVPPPHDPDLFMTWEQVRDLVANGIACQPHTASHPIMSRIALVEQKEQLQASKAIIEAETPQKAVAFAYPNGTVADYSPDTITLLKELDYEIAFTLNDGPMPYPQVRQKPFEIERIFLSYRDTLDVFILKLMGLPKFMPEY